MSIGKTMRPILLGSAAIFGLCTPCVAQQTSAAADDSAASPSEIIVTASRRAQTLQNTAMAVTAVTAQKLDSAGVTNSAALQAQVPGLQYSTAGEGSNFVYLRGVGNAVYGGFSDNSVATYVDGVYLPRNSVANQELFDVQQIEVLRGPQATLYGRNATGGAVLIETAAPTRTFTAAGDMSIGDYGDRRARAVLSGPIAGEVDGRISLVRHTSDGYNTNLADGSHYGGQDFWGVRASLSAPLGANARASLIANYSKEDGTLGASKAIDPASPQFLPLAFGGYGGRFSPDPRASYNNVDAKRPLEAYGATLHLSWNLGFGDLVSTSSQEVYRNGPQFSDLDDSDAAVLEYRGYTERTKATYQDLLLRSRADSGAFEWLLGATYVRDHTTGLGPTQIPGGPPPISILSNSSSTDLIRGYAVYGELTYALVDTLKLVAGLRYSHETRAVSTTDLTFGQGTNANRKSWNNASPKFSLEYRPNAQVMIYASATSGFKSGAFDPQNPSNVVKPEKIWNYELGAHTRLGKALTINASLFHYDMKDRQLFSGVTDPATQRVLTYLQNAGGSRGDGAELELAWEVIHDLRVGANVSLLHARYTKGTILADTANAVTYPVPSVTSYDVGGNEMEQAPRFSGTLFGDLRVPLGRPGNLTFHADYFHQGARFFTPFEDPTLRAGAYNVANARVTFTTANDHWYISSYIRNIGNSLIAAYMSRVRPFGTLVAYAPPRTYGVEAGFKF